jgi:transcriptional regulator with XRE-family HTH domain
VDALQKWNQAFGAALRQLRHDRQVSQENVALATHIERSYMSGLERGLHSPGFAIILTLSEFFDINVSDFMSKVEYHKKHPQRASKTEKPKFSGKAV